MISRAGDPLEEAHLGADVLDDDEMVVGMSTSGAYVLPKRLARLTEEQRAIVAEGQQLAVRLEEIRAEIESFIPEARAMGVPWSVLAWSFGLTETTLRKRFARQDGEG